MHENIRGGGGFKSVPESRLGWSKSYPLRRESLETSLVTYGMFGTY